jgi:hypothetical protein
MKKIFFIFFALITLKTNAQNDLGLNFSKSIWQNNYVNPASIPKNKIVVALTSGEISYYNTFGGVKTISNVLTAKSVAESKFRFYGEINTFGVGFGIGEHGYGSISNTLHSDANLTSSGDLVSLLVNGNASFIGKKLQLAPTVDFSNYGEWAATYAHNLGKLTVGGKVKKFNGIGAIRTKPNSTFGFTTESDAYQLAFDVNYSMQVSRGFSSAFGSLDTVPTVNFFKFQKDGSGFGLDLGANFDVNDKITVGVSAINLLGKINWKNAQEYNAKAKFRIEGFDITQLLQDSTFDIKAPNLDTILNKMSFTQTTTTFSTSPTKAVNLTGTYRINPIFSANALLGFSSRGSYFALNGTASVNRFLEAGLTYSIRNKSYANFGANVVLKGGPVQAYVILDNFAGLVTRSVNNCNLRAGINLAFGNTKAYQHKETVGNEKKFLTN